MLGCFQKSGGRSTSLHLFRVFIDCDRSYIMSFRRLPHFTQNGTVLLKGAGLPPVGLGATWAQVRVLLGPGSGSCGSPLAHLNSGRNRGLQEAL